MPENTSLSKSNPNKNQSSLHLSNTKAASVESSTTDEGQQSQSQQLLGLQPETRTQIPVIDSNTNSVPASNHDDESTRRQITQQQQHQQQQQKQQQKQQKGSSSTSNGAVVTNTTTTSSSGTQGATTTTTKIPPTIKDHRKIFVGGLPSDVTPDEFRLCFEKFGVVIDSVIMYDRVTTRSRGFGFVTFDDPDVCHLLIQKKRIPMRVDKLVEIKESQPRETTNNPTSTNVQNNFRHHHQQNQMNLHFTNHMRNGSDVTMMMPTGESSYLTTIGENFVDSSYMGMQYGSASDAVPSPASFQYGIDGTLPQQQFYQSNVQYSNPMMMRDMTSTPTINEMQSGMFGGSSAMSPSNGTSSEFVLTMPYGGSYLSTYEETMMAQHQQQRQRSMSVPNMNMHTYSFDGPSSSSPMYNNSTMTYYNNFYIPHPEIPNNPSSPNRMDHPTIQYDTTMISSPTNNHRPIYMMYPTSPVIVPHYNIPSPPVTTATHITDNGLSNGKHIPITTSFNGDPVVVSTVTTSTTNGDSKTNEEI